VTAGPHIGDGMPAASRYSGDMARGAVPCSGSLLGGPRLGFQL
jgi:hypothetical protein